jgi:hypothetical protein
MSASAPPSPASPFEGLRRDAGFAVALLLKGRIAAQGYLALDAGHGPTFGYNFTRFF